MPTTDPVAPAQFGPRTQALLPQLTIEEKAAITAGSDFFDLTGVSRLGLPNWRTTDGPNGARGSSLLGSGDAQATCIPCGVALGATWDPDLVEALGVLLGDEARTKACRVLLAPTVNLHRSPLAGRNFECFSEDPLLSGKLAAAYVRGVQSQGVITTVKHLVGNECETDRDTSNSIIDERTLRELYLLPFELAVREGGSLGIMTSYNRLNGRYCTEQAWLLTDVLRGEWGFEGFVTTDWFAGADTEASAAAGLTIEMPVGERAFGAPLAAAVREGRVSESALDLMAGRMLHAFESVGAWDDEPQPERSIDRPEHRALARRAAASSMVLLRNLDVGGAPLLPLPAAASMSRIAVIGPNAARAQIMGGGSANLRPFHRTSILDAVRARVGDSVAVDHAVGCRVDQQAPLLGGSAVVSPTGEPGFLLEVFDNADFSGEPLARSSRDTSRILWSGSASAESSATRYGIRATADVTPTSSGVHSFELNQITPARVFVDGELVADGVDEPTTPNLGFLGYGASAAPVERQLDAGRPYRIRIEIVIDAAERMFAAAELRVGAPVEAGSIEHAAAVAAAADVAIVVVGTTDDWETEGIDRTTMSLPGEQDELVRAVLAANPRTVVVVNAGTPVAMPWVHDAPAVLVSWLGGQEMADALVDVLLGDAEPGGRLPTTFPIRIEHTPSFGSFPGDNGQVPYAEGLFMGYRWYDSRRLPVLFPFGYGLSYTTFDIGAPVLSSSSVTAGETVTVTVPITNTGDRRGSHVVQCYVHPHGSRIARPDRELKAFRKVTLDPGETATVELTLDSRAFAYWDPAQPEWPALQAAQQRTLPKLQFMSRRTEPGWVVEPGRYDVLIAHHVADVVATATVELVAPEGDHR